MGTKWETAVVIGSGFGGLAAAIRLQARGINVTLLEKNEAVGGHAAQLVRDGYTFDMGPSLITAPDIIQRVFSAAGRDLDDYLDLIKLEPFYRIYYHDGTYLDYTDDPQRMKAQMAQFNPGDAANYDRFMEESGELYNAVINEGLGSSPFMDWNTMLRFLPRALRLNALYPVHTFVRRHFRDPRHRFAFSFHPLFIGGNPFNAPSVYLMIPYLERKGGVWFAKGGMYSLVRAFRQVFEEIGGTVRVNTPAREIMIDGGGVSGVRTDDAVIPADVVVSNADFAHTHRELIHPRHRVKWTDANVEHLDYSMSAFLIYLGVNTQYPKLKHHTLILSDRYKELVHDIFERKILPEDFSMYLHVPTRTDPGMAPEGHESMYVLVPVANLRSGIAWDEIKHSFANRILTFLEREFGLEGLSQHIEVMETFTPEDFQAERNSFAGSAWGVQPKLTQTAIFRPHNRSEDVDGLYFVGASTHPGAGVPGVLLTAETTDGVIAGDLDLASHQRKTA